jgi:hypothetical protein
MYLYFLYCCVQQCAYLEANTLFTKLTIAADAQNISIQLLNEFQASRKE